MKLRHLIGTAVLALTLGAGLPAAEAQYPPSVGNGRVTRTEVKQCQCVHFSGDGFVPGTTVTVFDRDEAGVETVVAKTTADAKGAFRVKVCFDEKAAQGEHTLIARGADARTGVREVRATVTVKGSVCFAKGDEVHNPNFGGPGGGEVPRDGGAVGGDGDGRGVDLPRTGATYVVPGLLLGFTLVVTGTGVVHLTRRRRLVTG